MNLDQFRATYIAECQELLEDMEQRLLSLNPAHVEPETLHAIFRCAHSIKGGAGAFGLGDIARFTHIMESLLDELRESRVALTPAMIDALLKSVDITRALVSMAERNETPPSAFGADVERELQALLAAEPMAPNAVALPSCAPATADVVWRIRFTPHADLFLSGNDPLLILQELAGMGDCNIQTQLNRLPPLAEIDPERCYLSWDIVLKTGAGDDKIRSAFEFVEDLCDLQITFETPEAASVTPDATGSASAAKPAEATASTSIRVDLEKIDRLMNLVGEIVITQAMIEAQMQHLPVEKTMEVMHGIAELAQHTRELQEAVMAVRMQPVRSIFSRLPRLVRDLSAQLGKEITLTLQGEQTEVDKTVIEQLSDPLTHLIRNAADHGVEAPDARQAAGKNREGTITVSAAHRGGRILIIIADDGAGINRERVLAKARERGLVAPDATLADEAVDQLIFHPGFSTAEQLSDVSGRGVGMDVVKRNIERMGGEISIESTPGAGTTFILSLPLTLAILDGMIVRAGEEHYIIPITSIMETLRPAAAQVQTLPDGTDILAVRGSYIPLVYLHRVFAIGAPEPALGTALVVLVESGRDTVGLVVDELIGQQQVVIKSLETNSRAVPGISGATILGDGRVSLILEVSDLKKLVTPNPHSIPLAA